MPGWKATAPKDDRAYFERMATHIFSAGLNWQVVESKKEAFRKAFDGYSPDKVAGFTDADVRPLLTDTGIIRIEKKTRSTTHNASQLQSIRKEYGSFEGYLAHFGRYEESLQEDPRRRFQHLGPSTARMFLWSVGYPLTPDTEEKKLMASHKM